MDLTHKDENTESTEERTIMMDSIKALNTGEVRNEDSSDDSGYESVPGGEESLSGDGGPAEDEVTEEEYQEYLAAKKERNKKIKAKNRHRRTFSHILTGVLLSVFIISISAFLATYIVKSALDFTGIGKTYCQAEIHINEDSTTDEIAQDLANLGIINMPDVFKLYTKMFGTGDKFIKGTFTVDTTMSYSALISELQTVSTVNQTVSIQITEGMTIDEIAQMMDGFNQMMDRVDTLMEERVEYGRQIKNLELKALQAQINPHFLYNSLDLINCTAISRNVPEISRMVNALGRFYRLSLSKGREVIPLSDELKHAQLYVEIQNLRFENRVSVRWALDPAAAQCRIIKIVLQPLIENAIIHGIFEKPSKCGRLAVAVRREPDGIRITIEDDGVGMDEATLLSNFSPAAPGQITATPGGYGVRNIQDRLRLAYGEPFGLSCVSRPGKGTTVTVYIPAIEPEEQPQEG